LKIKTIQIFPFKPYRPLTAILLFLCILHVSADPRRKAEERAGVHFVEWSFKEVSYQARISGKPFMVFVTAPYCGESRRMEYVFKSIDVSTFLNKNFICQKLNADGILNNFKAVNMQVTSVPTFFFFDAKGKLLLKEEGYHNKEKFMDMITLAYSRFVQSELAKKQKGRPNSPKQLTASSK
jgi:thioredoxin-related protein